MMSTPPELTSAVLSKAIGRYYKELKEYESKGATELNLRPAFQNLLADVARRVNLTLMHEMTIRGRIRPDGVLVNDFNIRRGYWEAKGPKGNLEAEIEQKKRDGYPLDNALFENTRKAVLFQGGHRFDFNMQVTSDVVAMLQRFLVYEKPETATFEQAVLDFKDQIPNIAKRLLELIDGEQQRNAKFIAAFNAFHDLCRTTLNQKISADEIKEMLIQHLLTERLFRTVFDNPDFVRKNAIAAEIEKVIQALTSRSFNRSEFLRSLDPFYGAIEAAAKGIETWSERQSFLNTVYERFFQGFAVQKADTLGIVYTPQEIVDFMVASVDEVLRHEFGKGLGLATPGVKVLDPCVGTGNFIVNIIKYIASRSRSALHEKYIHDLFCNEIALLPYYIASMNIEHEYYEKMNEYASFEGICFVDTLELAEGRQLPLWVVEENTERIKQEKAANIMVVIGNPPYNVGQTRENDNNKNRKYPIVDQRIKDTYVKNSHATLRTQLYDAYVRFFRWAADRLQKSEGIVCLVTNNSFVDQIAFDGMRMNLLKDFTQIYHLDLHGNVRKNPKISGTKHNVFGIQVGVGITIAIRSATHTSRDIYYYRLPEYWTKSEKLNWLKEQKTFNDIEWLRLIPDANHTWITEGLREDFSGFLTLGSKVAKNAQAPVSQVIFKTYSAGINSGRDQTVYDFNRNSLNRRIQYFAEEYNAEIARWLNHSAPDDIDSFVRYDRIKWSRNLKRDLRLQHKLIFDPSKLKKAIYRPFSKYWLYFSDIAIDERGTNAFYFPTNSAEAENVIICVPGLGNRKEFGCLAANAIPSMDLAFEKIQSFPYYTYAEDGSNRRENITDWALQQFQEKYSTGASKWDIFHYVYAILHHPQYRGRYAENLKRDLPHIPLLNRVEAYQTAVRIGQALMELHINYEQQEPYPLTPHEDPSLPFGQLYIVEKMKLTPDRSAVVVNKGLTLAGIPEACFRYRLGNRSALEWVIDQYQISKDARSGIVSDPNNPDDSEYIVRLVKQVVTVSVKTMKLVDELAQAVKLEDWLGEISVGEVAN